VTKIILKFEQWLVDQQERKDLVGDLAHVLSMQNMERQSSRRKSDEHKKWVDVVISIQKPELVDIFNEAWQEFLLAKQLSNDVQEGSK